MLVCVLSFMLNTILDSCVRGNDKKSEWDKERGQEAEPLVAEGVRLICRAGSEAGSDQKNYS